MLNNEESGLRDTISEGKQNSVGQVIKVIATTGDGQKGSRQVMSK